MTFCLCQQLTRVKSDNVCRSTHHHLHEACQTPEGLHLILSHKEERRQEITHALNITCKHNRPQTKKKKRGNIWGEEALQKSEFIYKQTKTLSFFFFFLVFHFATLTLHYSYESDMTNVLLLPNWIYKQLVMYRICSIMYDWTQSYVYLFLFNGQIHSIHHSILCFLPNMVVDVVKSETLPSSGDQGVLQQTYPDRSCTCSRSWVHHEATPGLGYHSRRRMCCAYLSDLRPALPNSKHKKNQTLHWRTSINKPIKSKGIQNRPMRLR